MVLLTATLAGAADKQDDSTKVTATAVLSKELASFSGRTLELRPYEYDPLLADANLGGISLVEKNMTIGGQPVTAGDFLLVETKGTDNIVHYCDQRGGHHDRGHTDHPD